KKLLNRSPGGSGKAIRTTLTQDGVELLARLDIHANTLPEAGPASNLVSGKNSTAGTTLVLHPNLLSFDALVSIVKDHSTELRLTTYTTFEETCNQVRRNYADIGIVWGSKSSTGLKSESIENAMGIVLVGRDNRLLIGDCGEVRLDYLRDNAFIRL